MKNLTKTLKINSQRFIQPFRSYIKNIIFSFCIIFLLLSCDGNKIEKKFPVQRNVIVLLDLSDRIILNKNQPSLDKETISAIIDIFISSIKDTIIHYDKNFNLIKDKFSIRIADQKSMDIDKEFFEKSLQFDFSDTKANNYKYILQDFQSTIKQQLDTLYKLAAKSSNPKDYNGADLWKFFNEDLETMINENAKNYLFIITNGYLYFENYNNKIPNNNRRTDMKFMSELRKQDWENTFDKNDMGLIPLEKNFSNLKIAVLEIAPKDFWNEYDLIKKVWGKWFNEMGVKDEMIMFSKSGNSIDTKNKIKEFLK